MNLNIRKLYRYLIPILALPLALMLIDTLRGSLMVSITDMEYELRACRKWHELFSNVLLCVSLVGIGLPAYLLEAGKAQKARLIYRIAFIVFYSLLLLLFIVDMIIPFATRGADGIASYMRIFGLMVVLLAGAPFLFAFFTKKYRMLITLLGGFGLCFIGFLFGFLLALCELEGSAVGLSDAFCFVGRYVVPFAIIPYACMEMNFN